jgi:hypothetical protein
MHSCTHPNLFGRGERERERERATIFWAWREREERVKWLYVDGHYVDCHLCRASLSCHLRRIVTNVDTNVGCRLRRIVV